MDISKFNTAEIADFVQKLTDPSFRLLFEEYIRTITNNDERQKFEQEYARLKSESRPSNTSTDVPEEAQASKTKQLSDLIEFETGFCISVVGKFFREYKEETRKIFVNICWSHGVKNGHAHMLHGCKHHHHNETEEHGHHHHDHENSSNNSAHSHGERPAQKTATKTVRIEETGEKKAADHHYWEIPYVLDMSKKAQEYKIYSIAFGPKMYQRSVYDEEFRKTLVQTALEAIEQVHDESLVDKDSFVVLPDTSFMEFIDGSSRLASQPRWDPPVLLNDLPGGVKVIHFLNDVIPEQLIKDETIRQVAKAELQARWRRLGAIPFPRVSFSLDSISQSQETVVILDAEAGVAASVPGKISLRQTDATLTLLIDSPNVVQESIKISISENELCGVWASSNGDHKVLWLEFVDKVEPIQSFGTLSEHNLIFVLKKKIPGLWTTVINV